MLLSRPRASTLYRGLLTDFYGDTLADDPLLRVTWARISHSTARRPTSVGTRPASPRAPVCCRTSGRRIPAQRADGVRRFLNLLRAGSKDHPMALLKAAGVDLAQPETVGAIVAALDGLVSRLETELDGLGLLSR